MTKGKTPNGHWDVTGMPFPGIPVVALQRAGSLNIGYAWWIITDDYTGPVGQVYSLPPHTCHYTENTLLGGTGRYMSQDKEYRDQIYPFTVKEKPTYRPYVPAQPKRRSRKRR